MKIYSPMTIHVFSVLTLKKAKSTQSRQLCCWRRGNVFFCRKRGKTSIFPLPPFLVYLPEKCLHKIFSVCVLHCWRCLFILSFQYVKEEILLGLPYTLIDRKIDLVIVEELFLLSVCSKKYFLAFQHYCIMVMLCTQRFVQCLHNDDLWNRWCLHALHSVLKEINSFEILKGQHQRILRKKLDWVFLSGLLSKLEQLVENTRSLELVMQNVWFPEMWVLLSSKSHETKNTFIVMLIENRILYKMRGTLYHRLD